MPARKRHTDPWNIMRLRLPPGTFVRIQKVLKQDESKTELIREALERELKRRENKLRNETPKKSR